MKNAGASFVITTLGKASLIDRMTAEAQAARDAHGYNEWETDGKVGKMKEDWVAIAERARIKFGGGK
jgi:hypothetical protein